MSAVLGPAEPASTVSDVDAQARTVSRRGIVQPADLIERCTPGAFSDAQNHRAQGGMAIGAVCRQSARSFSPQRTDDLWRFTPGIGEDEQRCSILSMFERSPLMSIEREQYGLCTSFGGRAPGAAQGV